MVGAVGEMASMKQRKLWKTGEGGLCCSSSAIQTRLDPSSLLEERSETPIVFCCFFCVVGYPPNWGKRPRYIDIDRCTNLPLDLVRNELFEMIDRYFDINERKSDKYIVLNHFWKTAQFASVNRKGSYDIDKLKTALDYLLFNSFVRFRPHVLKQIKGIPMGGNASPLIADLFLANLEFKYMDTLVSSKSPENLRMAKKLSNNSRYIYR